MPTTLVVIDMQVTFTSSTNPTASINVAREIEKAKRRKAGIVFVEFAGCEPTHEIYKEMVKGYKKTIITTKTCADGSSEIIDAISKKQFNLNKLRICGVNSCYCVFKTVHNLLKWPSMKIEVATRACSCICAEKKCWDNYDPRLKLIY